MSLFPVDDKGRKMLPIFRMITGYFPKALREITKVCVANNVRYNPGRDPADINWARGKSPDQLGSAFRHMLERSVDGRVFEDVPAEIAEITGIERVYVLAEAAWRINAALELEIEAQEASDRLAGIESSATHSGSLGSALKPLPVGYTFGQDPLSLLGQPQADGCDSPPRGDVRNQL